MAGTPGLENVVTHWSKLIENFTTTSLGFYGSVEEALGRRKIPGLKTTRVDWQEGGVLSPRREYLRITGRRYSFDICAAPFGTGYFFSSWLVKRPARFVPLFLVLFVLMGSVIFTILKRLSMLDPLRTAWMYVSLLSPFIIVVALVLVAFVIDCWLVALCARLGWDDPEAAIMAVPLLGWIYEHEFAPQTYYRLDTIMMFRAAVHAVVLETIDGLMTAKGLRALTEDERKPVFQKLL
jgi:hypothetical protein